MQPSEVLATLTDRLSPPERTAVALLQLAIANYNTADGLGLFSGPGRYNILADRARLAAVKSRTLTRFWSELVSSLKWPLTPRKVDDTLLALLAAGDDTRVLRAIASDTAALVTIARALNDQDRAAKKPLFDAIDENDGLTTLEPEGTEA